MTRVTMWKANDGAMYKRRIDCADHERGIRKMQHGTAKRFLIKAWVSDLPLANRRLPAGTWIDDGMALYVFIVAGTGIEAAIRRAANRCRALRDRTGIPWMLDYEMQMKNESVYLDHRPELTDIVG